MPWVGSYLQTISAKVNNWFTFFIVVTISFYSAVSEQPGMPGHHPVS